MVNESMHRLFRRLRGEPADPPSYPIISKPGRLRLDPIASPEVALVARWFADLESSRLAFGVDASPDVLEQLIEEYIQELKADRTGVLMFRKADQELESEPSGFVRYKLYRKGRRRTARVGILVGDPSCRGLGMGSEAMGALLDYLFATRKVDMVELDTADFNLQAQRCFLNCGFELIRVTEVIDMHNRWTERRQVMRLEKKQWNSATAQPQS